MCSTDVSFFSTDVFYSNALHVLTAIELPVHLFGAFIVFARTPKKMSSVKQNMLILHCAGAFCDIYLSLIAGPVLAVPLCAGYPLGISVWLGIPTDVQVYLGFSLACVVAVAQVGFFEDRYHVLGNGVGSERSWKRRVYLVAMYLSACTFMIPAYLSIPNQNEGKMEVLRRIPCFPPDLLYRPGFFVLTLDSTIFLFCFASEMIVLNSQLIFFAIAIFYRMSYSPAKSKILVRLQKQFMVALGIQVIIPISVLLLPGGYLIAAVHGNYYNQASTNIAIVIVALHGLASTVTMLIVHKPYRDATLEVLRCSTSKLSTTTNGSNIWRTSMTAPVY